jgi:hypothetical protein
MTYAGAGAGFTPVRRRYVDLERVHSTACTA